MKAAVCAVGSSIFVTSSSTPTEGNTVFSKVVLMAVTVSALLLGGCATQSKMAFSDDAAAPIKQDKALYLITATIKNPYKPSHQPKLIVANVEKPGASSQADRLNFKIDDAGKKESDSPSEGSTYLLRLELDKGEYIVRGLTCMSSSFPIHGFFFAPIHANIKSDAPGVYYLGHVEATVRERVGNEFKAGGALPLIDQALAGASTGSFDIEISDRWATDESVLKGKFPALATATINKQILPPFDRAKAQQWWDAN